MQTRQLTKATWIASCDFFQLQTRASAKVVSTVMLGFTTVILGLSILLSSSVFSPALAESQKQQTTPTKIQAQYRVLDCPDKFSIGKLYVLSNLDLTTAAIDTNTAKICKHAQGRLTIPQKGYSFLVGNYALGESLQPLQELNDDDLQVLRLSKLTFNQSDLQYLTGLTGLQRIELDSTDVDDKELKTLAKLPNLVFISMTRSLITGKTLSDLAALKKLTDLQLGHNALCNGNLNGITAITSLKALRVQACQLRDKDLAPIGQMKNLVSLTLHENKLLTDKGIKHLAKMPNLHFLDIGQTSVTTAGLKELRSCPIYSLRVDNDQFKKEEIAQIKRIFPKATIKEESTGSRMDPTLFAPLH